MFVSKNVLLDHFKLLQTAVDRLGAEAILGISDFNLCLRKNGRTRLLYPQFMATVNGVRQYLPRLTADAGMFAGWLPYQNKRWALASDKLQFKHFVQDAGFNTPEFSTSPRPPIANVVRKRAVSSFGAQIEGPFRSSADARIDTDNGEYVEKFVSGKIIKAWFWDGEPICMEQDAMPGVVGDGESSIEALVMQRLALIPRLNGAVRNELRHNIGTTLRHAGLKRSDVLEKGVRQAIEFRYGSALMVPQDREVLQFTEPSVSADVRSEFVRIGSTLHAAIPPAIRRGTLFTVDAIQAEDGQFWLLEMNSNPAVHPYAYPAMLRAVLGEDAAFPTQRAGLSASANAIH